MGFFENLFRKNKTEPETKQSETAQVAAQKAEEPAVYVPQDEYERLGLTQQVSDEERELVAVIASAIISGDRPDSQVHIKSVRALDMDKLAAVLAISAIAAGDNPDSALRLVSIKEV